MKIAFLVGGLEPGADGVGDYTRLLAQEVSTIHGHECCIVALNDPVISGVEIKDARSESSHTSYLRLPSSMPWHEKIKHAQSFLNDFNPDWVSLQFVCYAFHPKGIVYDLEPKLRPLLEERKVHVMLHETWIGYTKGSPVKDKVVGAIQRHYILKTLQSIAPSIVHTSTSLYKNLLQRYGIKVEILPLFGNIPIREQSDNCWLFSSLQEHGLPISAANRHHYWVGGFFGSLPSYWPPEPLLTELDKAARLRKQQIVILSVGRSGGSSIWDVLAHNYQTSFNLVKLGEQSVEHISHYLRFIDFGFSVTPMSMIGKSGAVAAMLDHGVPVIVNRVDLNATEVAAQCKSEPLLHPLNESLAAELQRGLPRLAPQARLPMIAERFIDALS